MSLYRKFSVYLREKFGCRVHRLCLDAGFTCPNRDGTVGYGGCHFCDNRAFSLSAKMTGDLRQQILKSMEYNRKKYKARKFLAYFQPFSNTYAPVKVLREKYDVIREFPEIVGLAVGTRPDCLDEEKIDLLASYTPDYEVWLELGLPSIHDRTLFLMNRNHSYADFLKAYWLARKRPLKIAAHVILGLPGEGEKEMRETARECGNLGLDGLKIHPLFIIKGTVLEKDFQQKPFPILTLSAYIQLTAEFLELISPETIIMRLTGECRPELLVAPSWVNRKNEVIAGIEKWLQEHNSCQANKFQAK